ncbi:MAG TPA: peptide MFS transporter [Thermoanaerobaculia bacterium]|jgi:POT family proton-dependent oligopeptide transporter|nr:peptide MFS transporter [Thermoanaerobaculia bacterium]
MSDPKDKQWFGHPRGLSTLFFTEMWERFSYYGMRGILLLFLVAAVKSGGFGLTDRTGAAIYGLYVGFVYLMALPGGWVADRILGQRRAVFIGGCFIAAGHFSMAIGTVLSFYLGLCLIVIGTGLLKPNVSAMVADLYPEGGHRRDAGFSIFYSGINVGAMVGPLVCGFLGEKVNWHLGFGAAGVGMVLGLIQYRLGGKYLGEAGLRLDVEPARDREALKRLGFGVAAVLGVIALAVALQLTGVLRLSLYGVAKGTGFFMLGLALVYFGSVLFLSRLSTAEKKRIAVIFVFFMAAVLFWAGFEQAGSSMNLFAERMTQRVILGWEMPASFLQSVNSIFIILLAPVFGAIWIRLGRKQPSTPAKMGYGLAFLAIGFLVLAWGASFTGGGARVSMLWLIVTYLLHTVGELCLSPVGLSSVTKLSPRPLVGQMMGTWFMGTALGNLIAGLAAGGFQGMGVEELFLSVAKVTGVAGVVLLVLARPIRRLMGTLPEDLAVPAVEPKAATPAVSS